MNRNQLPIITLILVIVLTIFGCESEPPSAISDEIPPMPPTNLTADRVTDSTILLVWEDNSETESGFRIERKLIDSDEWVEVATTEQNTNSWENTGLDEYVRFHYRVFSFNEFGDSEEYTELIINTLITPPSSLLTSAVSHSQIDLSWSDNSSVEEGYRIERQSENEENMNRLIDLEPGVSTYSDSDLASGTSYSYRICAFVGGDLSEFTDVVTSTTDDAPILVCEPDSISFTNTASTDTITVSNGGGSELVWVATVRDIDNDWLSISSGHSGSDSGEIVLQVGENTGEALSGILTVSAEGADNSPRIIAVTQEAAPPVLSLSTSTIEIGHLESSSSFVIQNLGAGEMAWNITNNADWITLSSLSGTNDEIIEISCDANSGDERVSEIIVTAPASTPNSASIIVIQESAPPIFNIEPDSLHVDNLEGTITFEISNEGGGEMDWTVSETAYWFSLSPYEGTNNETITVSYDANLIDVRYDVILISAPDALPSPVSLSVTQEAGPPILVVEPDSITVDFTAGSTTFEVDNIGGGEMDWNIIENADWLTVNPESGTGQRTLLIEYQENTDDDRTTEIIVNAPDANDPNVSLKVTQTASQPILAVNRDTLRLSGNTDNAYFSIYNEGSGDMDWVITEEEPWLSVNPRTGTNDEVIRVTHNMNTGDEREGELIVSAPDANPSSLTITMIQPSVYGSLVSVDPDHADQGERLLVSITGMDTQFRFLSEHSWAVLRRNNQRIESDDYEVQTDELMDVNFEIPMDAEPGFWTISVEDADNYRLSLENGFRIDER